MAEGLAVADLDVEQIRQAITFMPIGEAQAWISQNTPTLSVPGVDVSPNWLGRLPLFPYRIKINIIDVEPLIFGEDRVADSQVVQP